MRVETIPLIAGIIVGLVGLGILADAWLPEEQNFLRERRRRERVERSLGGEASIGFGTLLMAAALIGRDSWAYGTVSVIAGSLLLVGGILANKRFFGDRIRNRGALRRKGG